MRMKVLGTGCKKDIWPPNIESYFIGLMEEEVKKGNRQTTTLTRDAWRRIKEEMKIQFGKEYTYDQFKNKFNQLRGKLKDFNNLLKMETGLGYNSATGKIIATDDEWKKLCEKYKFAKQFKKKGCLNYEKLCVIYGDTTATGANQHPSTKSPSSSNDDDSEGDFDKDEDDQQPKKKAHVSKDTRKRNARENAQVAFANAMAIFGEHTKKKMERMDKSQVGPSTNSTEAVGQSSEQDMEKIVTCLRVLEGLEGIDGASFSKALKLLKEDAMWRTLFMELSDDRKNDFVLNLV
ncbi:L10-interacting MYB domain-containing protein-like isoform X3 [Lotus japonicus]|uniref:L10-interacting MYB domain-containing protein-like isoform X3 n=1 Tax=Lotus japonicus TaxID=34305 RepID=UPI00259010F8|nr:L10-interacting MYB domain-containing protein-like isoform X3 [Lotus japonicus]